MIRIFAILLALFMSTSAWAQELSALARLEGAAINDAQAGTEITLDLSQPVPWRIFMVDGPPRFIMDFNILQLADDLDLSAGLADYLVAGQSDDGWTRLVVSLEGPAAVAEAGMATQSDGSARLKIRLTPTDRESFATLAEAVPQTVPESALLDEGLPMVVLDPGHGGLDPGAEAGGINEKELMLVVARELQEALIRGGLFDVALTRQADEFVPLETRITRARMAGADVFISLHADELPEGAGSASGITLYTLSAEASDEASRKLAERHNKDDLLAGVDVAEPGDEIALVLMDLARRDTTPRAQALAKSLETAFRAEGLALAGRPLRSGAFAVLKAPDIPSVLIELGFLSSEKDRERLVDPEWRDRAIQAIETALVQWSLDDTARSGLLRR
ncbi:MAG: N-acetylmuramoyl-L-alanine amidase [Pseudomonadota bacterium]